MSPLLTIMPEDPLDDSMLTKKFGKEVINYYAGSRLNRYSFLRSDPIFLKAAVTSPASRFVALNSLSPLVADPKTLARFTFADVQALIGHEPFAAGAPLTIFLGLLPTEHDFATESHGIVSGQPYFAVNVTPQAPYADAAEEFLKQAEVRGFSTASNVRDMSLIPDDAAVLAQARSVIDWNARHPFCAGCGRPSAPVEAGYKRICPPTPLVDGADCPTHHGTSNVCFPRTDPTMIAAVVSADGQRILLGRQARWPPKWYSALAGFLEPGESIEDAVRREVWEESGVRVGRVTIHSSQPWPFPSSLMIGAIAQALPDGEAIVLNDKELEDARWFTLDEAREALSSGTGPLHGPAPATSSGFRMPPAQAIANRLVTAVVEGYLSPSPKM